METQRLKYLLQRHLAATTTNREQQELAELLQTDTNEEAFTTVMAELMEKETPVNPANMEPWPNMIRAIVDTDKTTVRDSKTTSRRVMLYRLCAAAAVLLLIIVTVYEFIPRKPSGSLVAKIKPYHKIATQPGEQKEVTLPDGSHVWLNGASTLHYPDSFAHSTRSVILSGEAWFDVQHADKIPFLVTIREMDETTVQVVGTAFDIKAYPTQKTMFVSVQRGKVRVQQHHQLLATLEKGRQVRLTGATAELRDIDTANVAAWKQGNLYYKDEMLVDIVADLQRVFKDSIQIKNNSLKEIVTTAAFNKNIGIQNALHILCRITDARLSKKNGIYIIE